MSRLSGAHCVAVGVLLLGLARAGQAARAIAVQIDQGQHEVFTGLFYDHGGPISLRECLLRTGFERERRPAKLRLYRDPEGRRRARLSGPVTLRIPEWGAVTLAGMELRQDPGVSGYWRLPETEVVRLAPPPATAAGEVEADHGPMPHWPLLCTAGVLLLAALTWRVRQSRGSTAS